VYLLLSELCRFQNARCSDKNDEPQVVCTSVIVTVRSFDVVMRGNEPPSWFETSPTPLLTWLSASLQAIPYSCSLTARSRLLTYSLTPLSQT